MSPEHLGRSTLTVNRPFIRDFLAAESPCFALGLVEEWRRLGGFLALRPPKAMPPAVTHAGFRFGHGLLGNADVVVVQFVFAFYGFETYNVLVNPNNLLVRTVVTTMVQNEEYFFFALNADGSVTAFRADIGQEDLAGLKTNLPRIYQARTTEAQYREEIEAQLPYVRVTAVVKTLEAAVADGCVNIAEYDMLLLALGNPTVELAINEHLHALRDGPPAVFTWLEPLGIGGHALLTHNSAGGGCFECLYTSPGDQEVLDNRAAFAAPGQSFGRALSGCGSLHTPYGSVDAVQTAALATRLALAALLGTETGNPLWSWKGAADAFTAAGFRLSPRYEATEAELARHRYAYQSVGCRVCGSPETGNA